MELFKGLSRLANHRLRPSLRRQLSRGMQTDAQRSLAVFPAGSNGEFNLPEGNIVQSIYLVDMSSDGHITLQWFESYLKNRCQAVNINSTLSDFKDINIGIPQGSILGPLLFIVFVNSLPDSVKCKCVMYADDTTLLTSSSDPMTLEIELKQNLDMVANWFKSNHLTLNIKKTKLMMFGTWQALSKFKDISLTYDNNDIEIVDKFKYLGVVFDPHLSWCEHVNHMSSNTYWCNS